MDDIDSLRQTVRRTGAALAIPLGLIAMQLGAIARSGRIAAWEAPSGMFGLFVAAGAAVYLAGSVLDDAVTVSDPAASGVSADKRSEDGANEDGEADD
jgi:hypothetical protein